MDPSRSFPRHQVQIAGKILSPDMYCSADCTIRNISEDGAFVTTTKPVSIPDRVYLWQDKTKVVMECEVRWRKHGKLFGLHFTDIAGRAARRALVDKFRTEDSLHAGAIAPPAMPPQPARRATVAAMASR